MTPSESGPIGRGRQLSWRTRNASARRCATYVGVFAISRRSSVESRRRGARQRTTCTRCAPSSTTRVPGVLCRCWAMRSHHERLGTGL